MNHTVAVSISGDALHCVFHDIDNSLLQKGHIGIDIHPLFLDFRERAVFVVEGNHATVGCHKAQKWQHSGDFRIHVYLSENRIRYSGKLRERIYETAHPRAPFPATFNCLVQVRVSGCVFGKGLKDRQHAPHGVVDLMGNHAYHLFVCLFLSCSQFIGKSLHKIKMTVKPLLQKLQVISPVQTGTVLPDDTAFSPWNGEQCSDNWGVLFVGSFADYAILVPDLRDSDECPVGHRHSAVEVKQNNAHRRRLDKKPEECILFLKPQPLVFQTCHKVIEERHDTVGTRFAHFYQSVV